MQAGVMQIVYQIIQLFGIAVIRALSVHYVCTVYWISSLFVLYRLQSNQHGLIGQSNLLL